MLWKFKSRVTKYLLNLPFFKEETEVQNPLVSHVRPCGKILYTYVNFEKKITHVMDIAFIQGNDMSYVITWETQTS